MIMRKRIHTLIILLFVSMNILADAVGTWKIYKSYSEISQIAPSNKEVYVLASGSLYSYNVSDNSVTTYDKTTCLNGTDITNIMWSEKTQRLVITYSDSNIDILDKNGETVFINDLANKQISGDKTVNGIFIYDRYAYLATGFGIVKVDISNEYIADSYILDFSIEYCYIEGEYLYAVSKEEGTYRGLLSSNLLDKKQWERCGEYQEKTSEEYAYDKYHDCFWAQDNEGSLAQYKKEEDNMVQKIGGIRPDGPVTDHCWHLYWENDRLYITAGNFSYNIFEYYPGCVMTFDGNNWNTIETPADETLGYKYQDANCMAFDPKDKKHYYVGSMSGILEYYDGKFVENFNYHNSTVKGRYDKDNAEQALITTMTFDNGGNLWAMNGWTNIPIISRQSDGNWTNYPNNSIGIKDKSAVDIQGTYISQTNGYMWFVSNCAWFSVLYRYDYKNNVLDYCKEFYNQDGAKLEIAYLFGMAEDKKGNIWVASNKGPVYVSQQDAKNGNYILTQHKVPRNDGTNYADYLLNDVETRCIKIDDANRKWVGTTGNGVFVISDDCNSQEEHFTTNNSPLLSNHVYDIEIDPNTGIVYFSTDKGLCSYQGDNTTTNEVMTSDNVKVYPNPVTPDHTGDIKITGLSMNSDVKITTSTGVMVNQGTSRGGSYSWNGCDLNGNKVASGVYMVQVAKSDGTKGIVAKVAVVR